MVPNRHLARFTIVAENGPLEVYYFQHTEDLLFFTILNSMEKVPSTIVRKNTFSSLGQDIWQYMPTDERPCEPDVSHVAFKKCALRALEDFYRQKEAGCAPLVFRYGIGFFFFFS